MLTASTHEREALGDDPAARFWRLKPEASWNDWPPLGIGAATLSPPALSPPAHLAALAKGTRALRGVVHVGAKSAAASRRSIDYLLEGDSVKTNPHLARFAAAPYLPRLLAEPSCDALLRRASKSLRKELIEAYAVIEVLESHVLRGRRVDHLVDLCCGKGYLSLILALEFPHAQVLMVDSNHKIKFEFLRGFRSLRFVEADVNADGFEKQLEGFLSTSTAEAAETSAAETSAAETSAAETSAAEAPATETSETAEGGLRVGLGIHLCGRLSPRAIALFGASSLDALVLVPCCLDKRDDFALKMAARLAGREPYEAKVEQLTVMLREHAGTVNVVRDLEMRTHLGAQLEIGEENRARNAILVACDKL